MLQALAKGFRQLSDPPTRGVLYKAIAAAVAVFLVLWLGAWFLFDWVGDVLAAWLADRGAGGFWRGLADFLASAAGMAAMIFASFLLFPAVMTAVLSIFLDEVAQAVEARHYPQLPKAREQPVWEAIRDGLSLAASTIVLNLLALPLYFIPVLNVFVFYALNGYLLGREYFELVAVRRLNRQDVQRLRRKHRGRLIIVGAAIAVMLTIPLVNLVTPIVATAFMLHVFEGLRRRWSEGPGTNAAEVSRI
jgi:uncharacterized protein involved in cysteine biosynthesis